MWYIEWETVRTCGRYGYMWCVYTWHVCDAWCACTMCVMYGICGRCGSVEYMYVWYVCVHTVYGVCGGCGLCNGVSMTLCLRDKVLQVCAFQK